MRLTPPSVLMFLASVICAVAALLDVQGLAGVTLAISPFWLMSIAWGLMTAGVILRRL